MLGIRDKKWKAFKKLADAITMAERRGAVVAWRRRVNGVRFDATVVAPYSNAKFLIGIDLATLVKPVSRENALEFATKSEKARANLAILASVSGFHEDCKDVTKESGVRLLTSEAIDASSADTLTKVFDLVLHFYSFHFHLEQTNSLLAIPEEPGVLRMFMEEMKIQGPGIDTNLKQLLDQASGQVGQLATGKQQRFHIPLPEGTVIIHPNTGQKTAVTGFSFVYWLLSTIDLKSTEGLGITPYLDDASVKEELVKRNQSADASLIDIGFETTLQVGKFYYNPGLQFSYFCERRKKDWCHMVLVESYQGGHFLQARVVLKKSLSKQFVEVTEHEEIKRLTKLYERFTVSDRNLEGRFKFFVKNLEGAECIDELALSAQQQKAKKADFFFQNREFISELKSLKSDTFEKVEEILRPYEKSPEWPIIFGSVDLQQVLNSLPDKDEINAKIVEGVTDSLEGIIEYANRQIRTTKETFNLPDSEGMVIILNDIVETLTPELVNYRINKCLRKKTSEGDLRYPHIATVIVITTVHFTDLRPNLKASPIMIIPGNTSNPTKIKNFVDFLLPKWSAFDGRPLIKVNAQDFLKRDFKTFSRRKPTKRARA